MTGETYQWIMWSGRYGLKYQDGYPKYPYDRCSNDEVMQGLEGTIYMLPIISYPGYDISDNKSLSGYVSFFGDHKNG